jgi:hypothetical protein
MSTGNLANLSPAGVAHTFSGLDQRPHLESLHPPRSTTGGVRLSELLAGVLPNLVVARLIKK